MKESAGEANLTVVAIILIAVIVAIATPLINSLMSNAKYRSCCTDAGGVWNGGICKASTPTTCANREAVFASYDQCVKDVAGYTDANLHYRAVKCTN